MMGKLKIYAIYDKKSKKYDNPFFATSDLFASRRFALMVSEEKSPLNVWPGDFRLDRLGNVNINTGAVGIENVSTIKQASDVIMEIKLLNERKK